MQTLPKLLWWGGGKGEHATHPDEGSLGSFGHLSQVVRHIEQDGGRSMEVYQISTRHKNIGVCNQSSVRRMTGVSLDTWSESVTKHVRSVLFVAFHSGPVILYYIRPGSCPTCRRPSLLYGEARGVVEWSGTWGRDRPCRPYSDHR